MKTEEGSFLKTQFQGWKAVLIGFVLITVVLGLAIYYMDRVGKPDLEITQIVLVAMTGAMGILVFFMGLRWLRNWNNFRKFLFAGACLITVLLVLQTEENWRWKRAWNNFKAEQKARGIPMDMAEIVPKPVPDDQNFALTPVVASCYSQLFDSNGRRIIPTNTNVVNRLEVSCFPNGNDSLRGNWQKQSFCSAVELQKFYQELATENKPEAKKFPVPEKPGNAASDVLYALSIYNPVVEDLRAASRLPESRFPLEYDKENPTLILLPHLAYGKQTVVLLSVRASMEIQAGQPDKALEDIQLGFKMMDSIATEPFLISQLVRLAEFNILLQPIYEGLAQRAWTDAQLESLRTKLAYDFCKDYRFAMNGELVFGTACVDYVRKNRRDLEEVVNNDKPVPNRALMLIPSSLFYINQLTLAELNTKWFLPIMDQHTNVAARTKAAAEQLDGTLTKPNIVSKLNNMAAAMLLPALAKSAQKFSMAETHQNLARTAIALERYRLAQGKYPETLAPLSPQYLASIPNDLIDGQPIRYHRTEDGAFAVYSIGWNEKDDGGVIGYKNDNKRALDKEQGDWVWQYPQKN